MAKSDLEPPKDGDVPAEQGTRKALSNVRRELSEDELGSSAVQRMLLDDLERLETDVGELSRFKDEFHSADKRAAVLEERLRGSVARDGCLGVGAAIVGVASSLWSSHPAWWIVGGLGVALVFVALLSRRSWA